MPLLLSATTTTTNNNNNSKKKKNKRADLANRNIVLKVILVPSCIGSYLKEFAMTS